MKRRLFLLIGASTLLPWAVMAQRRDEVPVVGLLYLSSPPPDAAQRASQFRNAMIELGWQEGRDIRYEHRFASGRERSLEPLTAELIGAGVRIIVAFGTEASLAARRATATVPIVMLAAGDPLALGLVTTLARPAGNVTGVSMMTDVLVMKQLELLKEAVPRVRRVALLHGGLQYEQALITALASAAARLGIVVVDRAIRREDDIAPLFREIGAEGFILFPNPVLQELRGRIAEQAIAHRLPGIGSWQIYANAGLLFSYGASLAEMQQRAAGYADRILKGAGPGGLPIEQPTRFELTVNRATAWALGLELPPAILARADEVIE